MAIKPWAFGAALGVVWGVSILITTWVSYYTGYGEMFLNTMAGSIYPGYSITPVGSFIGCAYGFLDGLFGGAAVAWIYNKIAFQKSGGGK